jgi:hypothetical protein
VTWNAVDREHEKARMAIEVETLLKAKRNKKINSKI